MVQKALQRMEKKEDAGPNLTGIPTQMKLNFEQRSGLSFDDVRVHYNSDKPAQLHALAYTQGTQVYIGPGQERHLPHELGHVVQQKQRRVPATATVNGRQLNDSASLEREASLWGQFTAHSTLPPARERMAVPAVGDGAVQRVKEVEAIEQTFSIDRGNQRGSIDETGGMSAWKVKNYRIWFVEVFWPEFLKKFPKAENLSSFVEAIAVEILKAGNCDEFSAVTFAYLAQNSKEQWVYRCHLDLEGKPSHSFTMTSKAALEDPLLPGNADLNEITVVDGWDSYQIVTLRMFYEGKNLYGVPLDLNNPIRIDDKAQASIGEKLSDKMILHIEQAMDRFLSGMPAIPDDFMGQLQGEDSHIFEDKKTVPEKQVRDLRPSYSKRR